MVSRRISYGWLGTYAVRAYHSVAITRVVNGKELVYAQSRSRLASGAPARSRLLPKSVVVRRRPDESNPQKSQRVMLIIPRAVCVKWYALYSSSHKDSTALSAQRELTKALASECLCGCYRMACRSSRGDVSFPPVGPPVWGGLARRTLRSHSYRVGIGIRAMI